MNENVDRSECYFCSEGHSEALEEHHIVPQRFNGSDEPENTVWLCGSCHDKIERLYDDEFYRRLGVAVDEVKQEPTDRTTTGHKVKPRNSNSREIPAYSPHIEFEDWDVDVTITGIREGDVPESISPVVEAEKEAILSQYETERAEAWDARDVADEWDEELPEWVNQDGHAPVSFAFEHGNMAEYPVPIVQNPEKDYFDRERAKAADDDSDYDWVFNYKTRKKNAETGEAFSTPLEKLREDYPDYYRLHCGYCHTVFSMHEHADMARHLRMRHGIENPYEEQDTAFEEPSERSIGDIFSGIHD